MTDIVMNILEGKIPLYELKFADKRIKIYANGEVQGAKNCIIYK